MEIKIVGNTKLVVFQIGNPHFNRLEEAKGEKHLLIEESAFIQAVMVTSSEWKNFEYPQVFRPLAHILMEVKHEPLVQDSNGQISYPIRMRMRISGDAIIISRCGGNYEVLIPVDEFIRESIAELARCPKLNIGRFDGKLSQTYMENRNQFIHGKLPVAA